MLMFITILIVVIMVVIAYLSAALITSKKVNNEFSKTLEMAEPIDTFVGEMGIPQEYHQLMGLIVEPRDHVNLIPVIENFKTVLPNIPIRILCGPANKETLSRYDQDESVELVDMGVENLCIEQYNYIMTRPKLYESLPAKHVLVFQTDSVLFTQNDSVDLHDYLVYDYVGAPWTMQKNVKHNWNLSVMNMERCDFTKYGGNGGLSLRNVEVFAAICEDIPYTSIPIVPEDVYFSYVLKMAKAKLPTSKVAAQLFFESVYSDKLPFGAHKFIPKRFSHLITDDEIKIVEHYKP